MTPGVYKVIKQLPFPLLSPASHESWTPLSQCSLTTPTRNIISLSSVHPYWNFYQLEQIEELPKYL